MSPDLVIITWRVLSCNLRKKKKNLVFFRCEAFDVWCVERNVVELNHLDEFEDLCIRIILQLLSKNYFLASELKKLFL